MITEEQIKEAYAALSEYEQKIIDHNNELIKSFGKNAEKYFEQVIDGCENIGQIEFVDKPHGEKQHEHYGIFRNIHIQQWSVGMDGDSFEGYIFANVRGRWIKIPYSC